LNMRCNKVLYFDIFTICDNMCVWTSWAHIFEYLVLLSKLGVAVALLLSIASELRSFVLSLTSCVGAPRFAKY